MKVVCVYIRLDFEFHFNIDDRIKIGLDFKEKRRDLEMDSVRWTRVLFLLV